MLLNSRLVCSFGSPLALKAYQSHSLYSQEVRLTPIIILRIALLRDYCHLLIKIIRMANISFELIWHLVIMPNEREKHTLPIISSLCRKNATLQMSRSCVPLKIFGVFWRARCTKTIGPLIQSIISNVGLRKNLKKWTQTCANVSWRNF
jgi:hypothetical protein